MPAAGQALMLLLLLLLAGSQAALLPRKLQQELTRAERRPGGGCRKPLPGWGAAAHTSGRGWPRWGAGLRVGGSRWEQMLGRAGGWGWPRKWRQLAFLCRQQVIQLVLSLPACLAGDPGFRL